jgi:predicted DNA-binding transcriptional regulator YafY
MPKPRHIQFISSALRDGRTCKAEDLAEKMECSERTVRRCMDHLRNDLRWPIESGKSGFFLRAPSIAETRITGDREVAALAMAHEAVRVLGWSDLGIRIREELMKAGRNLADLGTLKWDDLGKAVQQRLPSGQTALNHEICGKLTLAILQEQVVEIRYRKLEEDHTFLRRVFPQKLICRDCCWYLIAWDLKSEEQKTYTLPRISRVSVQPRPKRFVVPEFDDRYQHAFGIWTPYEPDGTLYDICVELTGYWARIAKERQWHPSQKLEELAPDQVRVHFQLSELVEVKSWVLTFGGAATVIAPDELRDLVREELEEMQHNYGS